MSPYEKKEEYYNACRSGDIEKIKQCTKELNIQYYDSSNRAALRVACQSGQLKVIQHIFSEIAEGYKVAQVSKELVKDESPGYNFGDYLPRYALDIFRDNLETICKNGHIDILKEVVGILGGIHNHNDFEKCAQYASANGDLEMVKYLLSVDGAQSYINYWQSYNTFFQGTSEKSNEVIKYFLDTPELNKYIKPLSLMGHAHRCNNIELIEYMIFDKDMLYSKKVRKAVQNLVSEDCNIPQLFANRETIRLAEKLHDELKDESDKKKRLKI